MCAVLSVPLQGALVRRQEVYGIQSFFFKVLVCRPPPYIFCRMLSSLFNAYVLMKVKERAGRGCQRNSEVRETKLDKERGRG